jgi:hypothetical protein
MAGPADSSGERGRSPDPGTAREEAERLVATAIGAASMAARRIGRTTRGPVSSSPLGEALPPGLGTLADALVDSARSAFGIGHTQPEYRVANGSPECCVCPVCRTIAAVRDPSPQMAERLATGAGDLAAGVASFLRAVSGAAGSADRPTSGAGDTGATWPAPEEPVSSGALGDVWQAATRDEPGTKPSAPGPKPPGPKPPGPKPMAKKAVKPAARPNDQAPGPEPGPKPPEPKPMAKKAVKPAARPNDQAPDGGGSAGRGDEAR